MATFLTTRRMAPELRERIERSVSGKRRSSGGAKTAAEVWKGRGIALARFAAAALAVALVVVVVDRRWRAREEFERTRAALLGTSDAAAASLTKSDVEAEERMEAWLVKSAGAYDEDVIADRLRAPGALAELLSVGHAARAVVYVRGTLAQFGSSPGIAEAAATSLNDPLLACLLDPPSSRSEKALLARVHETYSGDAAVRVRARNVQRLRDVQLGLPFLVPAWTARVNRADTTEELVRLRRAFDRAPVLAAKQGLQAELLLFAIDEPGDTAGPTELDGERAHDVRIGLVDLASDTMLLRMRRRVDPSTISAEKRSLYASGIDACALAADVRAAVL